MKKISPKQYACSLYEAIKGKPKNELDDVQHYLEKTLYLIDDGSFPALVQSLEKALHLPENNIPIRWSLSRLEARIGYKPRAVSLGILRELGNYPELHSFLVLLLRSIGDSGKSPSILQIQIVRFDSCSISFLKRILLLAVMSHLCGLSVVIGVALLKFHGRPQPMRSRRHLSTMIKMAGLIWIPSETSSRPIK